MPKKDRTLIEKYSNPKERVFLISDNDAAYLLESKRAPGSPFVPMKDMVFSKNFDDFYSNASQQKYIFVDFRSLNSSLSKALLSHFSFKEKGEFLLLLENNSDRR